MVAIKEVVIEELYSRIITSDIITEELLDCVCDHKGTLELTLEPGHKLMQKGPYMIPPIRWLYSFEYAATFKIKCIVY